MPQVAIHASHAMPSDLHVHIQDVSRHGRLAAEKAAHEQRVAERDSFIRDTAASLGWTLPGVCTRWGGQQLAVVWAFLQVMCDVYCCVYLYGLCECGCMYVRVTESGTASSAKYFQKNVLTGQIEPVILKH